MSEHPHRNLFSVLPLRYIVVFPHMTVLLFVGREKSVRALEVVKKNDSKILLVTQKDATQDDPTPTDLYRVGTVATVLQLLKLPDGMVKVLVEGGRRARITEFTDKEDYFQAYAEIMEDVVGERLLWKRLCDGRSTAGPARRRQVADDVPAASSASKHNESFILCGEPVAAGWPDPPVPAPAAAASSRFRGSGRHALVHAGDQRLQRPRGLPLALGDEADLPENHRPGLADHQPRAGLFLR